MTCKDCIHERVCDALIKQGLPEADGKYPAEAFCFEFKNKSDYAKVVRCKDCTHAHWDQDTLFGSCVDFCDFNDLRIYKDHFCSYGERK